MRTNKIYKNYKIKKFRKSTIVVVLFLILSNFGVFATSSAAPFDGFHTKNFQEVEDYESNKELHISGEKERRTSSLELSANQFNQQTINRTVEGYRIDFLLPEGLEPYELIKFPGGNVWFTVYNNTNLWELNITSLTLTPHPLEEGITPLILRSDGTGNIVFTDSDFSINNIDHDYIGRYYIDTGNYDLYQVPTAGSIPFDVLLRDDKIWFTEWMANKIGMIDVTLNSTTEYDIPCEEGGCGPLGLNFDTSGQLWIVDTFGNQFVKFNPETLDFLKFPLPDKFYSPVVAAFDNEGNIWTGAHGGDNILKFNPNTAEAEQFMTRKPKEYQYPISGPNDVVFDSNGDIWFSEHFVDLVGRLDRETNTLIEYPIPREEPLIQWVFMDKKDQLWMSEEGSSIISVINTTMTPTFIISPPTALVEIQQGKSTTISVGIEFVDGSQNSFSIQSFGEIKDFVDITFKSDDVNIINKGQSIELQLTVSIGIDVDPSTYNAIIGLKSGDLSATIGIQIKVNQGSFLFNIIEKLFVFGITAVFVIFVIIRYYRGRKTA